MAPKRAGSRGVSYVLQAIVTRPRPELAGMLGGLSLVGLPQGLVMAPLADAVRARLGLAFCPLIDESVGAPLPDSVIGLLSTMSQHAKAAYVEAELFGGAGLQACLLAEAGRIVESVRTGPRAINGALSFLGVNVGTFRDEFEAAQLGMHRSTEDWIA